MLISHNYVIVHSWNIEHGAASHFLTNEKKVLQLHLLWITTVILTGSLRHKYLHMECKKPPQMRCLKVKLKDLNKRALGNNLIPLHQHITSITSLNFFVYKDAQGSFQPLMWAISNKKLHILSNFTLICSRDQILIGFTNLSFAEHTLRKFSDR